jgi:hypothetical protein
MLMCNENLFASKYRLYLPSEEELRAELQRECELIERQIKEECDWVINVGEGFKPARQFLLAG